MLVSIAMRFAQAVSLSRPVGKGRSCDETCADTREVLDVKTAIFVDTVKVVDNEKLQALHPLHGVGSPRDLVGAAIFLASNESRWITGVCLPVDGGYTAQ